MPAYSNLVILLASPANPVATVATFKQVVDSLPEEKQLEVLQEPGLLHNLNPLLAGDAALASLKVLASMIGKRTPSDKLTPTRRLCMAAIVDSSCFPSIKNIASTGSTPQHKEWAWATLAGVACMEEGRRKAMLDSPDMAVLLQSGMKSADAKIAMIATINLANLCNDKTTASAVLDDHPHLLQALVSTFSTSGVGSKFQHGCLALLKLAHTSERAINLLHAHFSIIATVEATTAGVAENDGNERALEAARLLLQRFPLEVQFDAKELVLQDTEAMRLSLDGQVKLLTHDKAALTSDKAALLIDKADLKKSVTELATDNAALRANIESGNPSPAESVADAAALNERLRAVKRLRVVEVKREPGEGDQQGGAEGASSPKRARK